MRFGLNPPPKNGRGDVWMEIINLPLPVSVRTICEERREFGIKKYNTPLQYDNGRDYKIDVIEEALDLAVYSWACGGWYKLITVFCLIFVWSTE